MLSLPATVDSNLRIVGFEPAIMGLRGQSANTSEPTEPLRDVWVTVYRKVSPHHWATAAPFPQDLIKQMLTINPTGRITVQGVVAHPWMQLEVPKEYEALSQEIQARANMAPPAPRPPATPPGPAPPQPAAGAASGPVSDLEDKHPTPDTRPVTENGDADTPPPPVNPRKRSFDEATLPHWYWQHNEDADPDTEAAWTAYGAAENERLERNFAVKKAVRLNSTYCVSFEHNIQYRADDPAKQRAVRRGTRGSVLREPAERGPVSREPSK